MLKQTRMYFKYIIQTIRVSSNYHPLVVLSVLLTYQRRISCSMINYTNSKHILDSFYY